MTNDDKAQDWCSNKLPCARYEAKAAEIERLREALHKIANESSDTWARRDAGIALAGKAEQ